MTAVGMSAALGLTLLFNREEPASEARQAQCGRPALTYADGTPLGDDRARDVAGVHAAACAGDYDALIPFIPDARPSSLSTFTAVQIVEDWRREDPAGVKLRAVAEVLERPGVGGQGGLVFCEPDKGLVGFSRGTIDVRPGLGGMEFPRAGRPVDCSPYAPG
ncbi:hypothetical protein GCM10009634_34510 [Saccharothrix xinjiangensis]